MLTNETDPMARETEIEIVHAQEAHRLLLVEIMAILDADIDAVTNGDHGYKMS